MIRNVALMGRAGSGKDTAAAGLAAKYGHVRVAFADPLRRMALAADPIVTVDDVGPKRLAPLVDAFGWDYVKRAYPEARRFLQLLGSEGVRDVVGPDTWVNIAHRAARAAWIEGKPVVITDVRYPNEVAYARRHGFRLIWIDRPHLGAPSVHASEHVLGPQHADAIVYNGGSPADLAARVGAAMRAGA